MSPVEQGVKCALLRASQRRPLTSAHCCQSWLAAGSFEAIVHDLRTLLRLAEGREAQPSAVIFDARTMQSTPESGHCAGYDGHKRKKSSKVHLVTRLCGRPMGRAQSD